MSVTQLVNRLKNKIDDTKYALPMNFFLWFFKIPKHLLEDTNLRESEYTEHLIDCMSDYIFKSASAEDGSPISEKPVLFTRKDTISFLKEVLTETDDKDRTLTSDQLRVLLTTDSDNFYEMKGKEEVLEAMYNNPQYSGHKHFLTLVKYLHDILNKPTEKTTTFINYSSDVSDWLDQLKTELMSHSKYYKYCTNQRGDDSSGNLMVSLNQTTTYLIDSMMNLNVITEIEQWRSLVHFNVIHKFLYTKLERKAEKDFKEEDLFRGQAWTNMNKQDAKTLCDIGPTPKLPRTKQLPRNINQSFFYTETIETENSLKINELLSKIDKTQVKTVFHFIISQFAFKSLNILEIDSIVEYYYSEKIGIYMPGITLQVLNENLHNVYKYVVDQIILHQKDKHYDELLFLLAFRSMPTRQHINDYFDPLAHKFFICLQGFIHTLFRIFTDNSSMAARLHDKHKLIDVLKDTYKFQYYFIHDKLFFKKDDSGERSLIMEKVAKVPNFNRYYAFRNAAKLYENVMIEHLSFVIFVVSVMFEGSYMYNINRFGSMLLGFATQGPLSSDDLRKPPPGLNVPLTIQTMIQADHENSSHKTGTYSQALESCDP